MAILGTGILNNYYLEGHGDIVGRLMIGIIGILTWLIGVIKQLTESP